MRLHCLWPALGALLLLANLPAAAGVSNPNLSIIGQPFLRLTDDAADLDHDRLRLDPGETEILVEDYLNPYARGLFTFALAEEGLELEEGYFAITRGLPLGLNLKGGKYRAEFGKLNAQHPHAYPFAERFRALAAYLPGEEALNEMGLQLSARLPAPGELSLVAAVDWLQGDSFRREREPSEDPEDPLVLLAAEDPDLAGESHAAVLGRLAAFAMTGERSGLELGLSAARGTNNVAAGTATTVLGADLKAKLWSSPRSYLLLQAEALRLEREDAGWDPDTDRYTQETVTPWGGYLYADYNFALRWNAGASYERYQQDGAEPAWDSAFGLFAGFAVMEESTVFRLGWERFQAGAPAATEAPDAINTLTLRVIYSMGPHKAHQF
jgi:hypothetical protein